MKKYQIVFNVPDDFNPEMLDISLTDSKYEKEVNVYDEGFVNEDFDSEFSIESVANKIIAEQLSGVKKGSVIVFKYPIELMNPDVIVPLQQMIEAKLGCTTVGIVDDVNILVQNSAEAINMLQAMINKINANAIIKLS